MKVFRVLSTDFVHILLFATCWHVFTLLLTCIHCVTYLHLVLSLDLVH